MTDRSELIARLKPFPAKFVHTNPSGGGSYTKHSVVVQRLLDLFDTYDFQVVTIIRGHVPGQKPNPAASRQARQGRDPGPRGRGCGCGVSADRRHRRSTGGD